MYSEPVVIFHEIRWIHLCDQENLRSCGVVVVRVYVYVCTGFLKCMCLIICYGSCLLTATIIHNDFPQIDASDIVVQAQQIVKDNNLDDGM